MDKQLERLVRECPEFLRVVQEAVKSALHNASFPHQPGIGEIIARSKKQGYANWILVEPQLIQAVEALGDPRISVCLMPNGGDSHHHLEVTTPWGLFMVAGVSKPQGVPSMTLYRQKYTDQIFMREALPEFEMFSGECIPLYVITYVRSSARNAPGEIFVGRLRQDQQSWAAVWPLSALMDVTPPELIVSAQRSKVKDEVIEHQRRIRVKRK